MSVIQAQVDYNDGGMLKVGELRALLQMHGLSTEGSKPNLYGRLRNFMRNGKIKNVNVKSEPGLLPLLLPKQVLAMQAGNVPYGKQQKQVQAHTKDHGYESMCENRKEAETQTSTEMCLSKLVELSEKKMAETQTESKDVESKLVGTDDMPPTSTRIVETQTEEFEMVVKPTVVETKEIDTQTEVVDKPIIIMVEAKMVGTQTDLVLAEKKSSFEKDTQDVKFAGSKMPPARRKRKASIEIEDLLEDLLPQLRCFNCHAEPSVPHRKRFKCFDQCHALCENCNQGCPCGSKVGKTECGLTAQILDKFLPRPCKNYKNGCKELLEHGLEGYEYHQNNCDFRMVNCPSIGCQKIVVSKLTDHLTKVHGFDFKQLIHCSPLNSWARDLRMQFNMQRLERSRLQIKPSSIDKGPKNVIFQFFKKLGAIATVVAPQIKFSSNPSRFEELDNTAITGVVLQTDDGPTFYFVGTCSNNFTYYWIYYSGTAEDAQKFSVTISVSGNTKDVFTFRGHVHPLDVDWRKIVKEQQDTMVIGLNAAKRLAANNDLYANFEIIIRKDY